MARAYLNLLLLALGAALICFTGCTQQDSLAEDYAAAYGSDNHATAGTRSGDYWYFNRYRSRGTRGTSGLLLPVTGLATQATATIAPAVEAVVAPVQNVFAAPFAVRVLDSKWYFDRGGVIANITAYFAEGEKTNLRYSPLGVVVPPRGSLSYIEVTLRGEGGKWYFDRSGNPLPGGYTPEISCWAADTYVVVKARDMFDKVQLVYVDGRHKTIPTGVFFARFPIERPLLGVSVRLKSDGSKWFIDNAGTPVPCGSKWFEDVDSAVLP